jgi:hypothetical protein
VDDRHRIIEQRPLMVHETRNDRGMPIAKAIDAVLQSYLESLAWDRRHLLARYRIVDVPLEWLDEVDPLVYTACGRRMSIVAFLTDAFVIRRVLDHLGLGTPEAETRRPCARACVSRARRGLGRPAEWE